MIIAAIILIAVMGGVIFGGIQLYKVFSAETVVALGQEVTVEIPEGSSTRAIATILKDKGVITSTNDFINAVTEQDVSSDLKPGTYTFVTGMDHDELITLLIAGPLATSVGNKLTIPEGYTLEQTAAAVESATGIPAAEFSALAHSADSYVADYQFLEGAYDNSMEGFLYPKTYDIPFDADADYVIRVLLDQFSKETEGLDLTYAGENGITLYDVVTIASLIERETHVDTERTLVSSVIYNRLAQPMNLQIDASIVYALGPDYDGHALLESDLQVDSPYNTYTNSGLPPGPICSPRLDSLVAAANPDQTDYLYYVMTSTEGTHTFCVTYDEFLEAKAVYKEVFGVQ